MVEKNSSTGEERGVISDVIICVLFFLVWANFFDVVQSETTQVQDSKSKRRRLFGLSSESTSIKEKASSIKESTRRSRDVGSPAPSSSPSDTRVDSKSMIGSGVGTIVGMNGEEVVPTRRHSKKRSTDERKASDRLSLFGSSFPSGLGKSRKPAPRLSS